MKQSITVETNHKPVYCRDCKGQNTFERFPEGDYPTASGKPYMLKWRCKGLHKDGSVCENTCLTSNRE